VSFGEPLEDAVVSKLKTVTGNQAGWVYPVSNVGLLLAIPIRKWKRIKPFSEWQANFLSESGPMVQGNTVKRFRFSLPKGMNLDSPVTNNDNRVMIREVMAKNQVGSIRKSSPRPEKDYYTSINKSERVVTNQPWPNPHQQSPYSPNNYKAPTNSTYWTHPEEFKAHSPWGKETPDDYYRQVRDYWPQQNEFLVDLDISTVNRLIHSQKQLGFHAEGSEWLVLLIDYHLLAGLNSYDTKVEPISFTPRFSHFKPQVDFYGILNWLRLGSIPKSPK
jgi:hypothetical protein